LIEIEVSMETVAVQSHRYALGHSAREMERLKYQGQTFEPFTRQLLREAGVAEGMRVLDIGSGGGDVAFLAAELVGPSGYVLGVDRAAGAVQWASARAHARGVSNVGFVAGDPALMESNGLFDALVGRLVLMYYPDPVDALRRLLRHVRPGGLVVLQEFDTANSRSCPHAPTFERAIGWIRNTLSASGARMELGLELYPTFVAAGLPGPCLRMDALIGGGPECPGYHLVAEVVKSLLPAMEKFNIATPAEVAPETLAERIRQEVVAANGVVLSPGLIGAWARKQE
jgi:SAM-dependent methyltransferase